MTGVKRCLYTPNATLQRYVGIFSCAYFCSLLAGVLYKGNIRCYVERRLYTDGIGAYIKESVGNDWR